MQKLMKSFKKAKEKLYLLAASTTVTWGLMFDKVFAEGKSSISTQQVTTITGKITDAVKDLAMPIGSLLIFVSVILTGIRIAVNHNNPKGRTENLASLGWLVIAGLILGGSLIIAGIIINVTSNGGSLYSA